MNENYSFEKYIYINKHLYSLHILEDTNLTIAIIDRIVIVCQLDTDMNL